MTMKRIYGRVAPVCGRTGGKPVRLSDTKVGALYATRDLGRLFGKENVLAMWHRGHGAIRAPEDASRQAQDHDNMVTVSVKYLTEAEREEYRVTIKDGALLQGGKPLDTSKADSMWVGAPKGWYLFVMDAFGRFYAADAKKEYAARGLGDYFRACDANLYEAVSAGIALRHWTKGAPVDHYKTVLLGADVPCALNLPGGKLGSDAPADVGAKWLADLGRTPFGTTAVANRIAGRPAERKAKAERKEAEAKAQATQPAPDQGALYPQTRYVTESERDEALTQGGTRYATESEPLTTGGMRYATSNESLTTGGMRYATESEQGGMRYATENTLAFDPSSDPESSASPLVDDVSDPGSYDSSDDSYEAPNAGLGPKAPVRHKRARADTGWACLQTIKPGQGVFVVTAPRTAKGTLDLAKLQTHAADWKAVQAEYAKEWQQREDANKTKHDDRQRLQQEKHDAAQQELPEAQRTAYVVEPFVPAPFVEQPYPGDPSESPESGGWVCRNCWARRRTWPTVQFFPQGKELEKEQVDKLYAHVKDEAKSGLPHAFKLLEALKPLVTKAQWLALRSYSSAKAPTRIEVFHHSSFLAGAPVAAAGEMQVSGGIVDYISNQSGHYLPPGPFLEQAQQQLHLEGVTTAHLQYQGNSSSADARSSSTAHGSQDDILSALRDSLERGVKLSRVKQEPRKEAGDAAIPCAGETAPGTPCKATSATVDFMDYVEGKGFVCQGCLDRTAGKGQE